MAPFVVRGSAAVLHGHHHLPLRPEDDALERVREVGLEDGVVVAAGREQRGLVDEVRQIGADHARRRRGDPAEVDVRPQRHAARVHLQDRLTSASVRRLHGDPAVEAARAKQGLVEHVRPVGRSDHDHARRRVEAVHLGEDLVQRLLALVVSAAESCDPGSSRPPDRVELVDEDDRRRSLLRLSEQIPHARGAHSDDRLDELGRGDREEGSVGLTRNGSCEERLAGARRAREQHAVRNPATELSVLLRMAEEVDDLAQLLLRLVDARNVLEGHAVT